MVRKCSHLGPHHVQVALPSGGGQLLTSGQLFLGNHAPYARRAYIQALCCFLQSYYVTILIIREIEDRQLVIVARRANPFVIPGVAGSRLEPKPIQRGRNLFVGKPGGHLSNDVNGLDAGTPPVSTYIVFLHAKFRMSTSNPVN